jgi:Histidine kinase-like ATPase domain
MMPRPLAHGSTGAAGLPQRVAIAAPPVIRVLPGVPESAATARQLVRHMLGENHPAADTAMLLVSELVTNSVMHSRSGRPGGSVTVAVCAGATSVLIQVRDDGGPSEPRMLASEVGFRGSTSAGVDWTAADWTGADWTGGHGRCTAPAGGEHGYGLLLVDALAETWGTIAADEGRVTWCRLAVGPPDEAAVPDTTCPASLPAEPAVKEHRAKAGDGEYQDQRHGDDDENDFDREPDGSSPDPQH